MYYQLVIASMATYPRGCLAAQDGILELPKTKPTQAAAQSSAWICDSQNNQKHVMGAMRIQFSE